MQGWSDSVATNLVTLRAAAGAARGCRRALAPQTRLYRTFFLDEIGHDYVRTARAKGLTERTVLLKHVLRNAHDPDPHQRRASALPGIFVGSFLIEVFFSIPGLGREVLLAVNRSDYPVIQAFAIYIARDHDGRQPRDRRALQAGRSAGGAEMSAVIERADVARRRRAGARARRLARRRRALRSDRVGMVSLAIVAAVPAARSPPRRSAWSRATGRRESGVPNAPPSFVGPAALERGRRRSPRRAGPNVDISAVDPLAPRYKEWAEAAKTVPDDASQQGARRCRSAATGSAATCSPRR